MGSLADRGARGAWVLAAGVAWALVVAGCQGDHGGAVLEEYRPRGPFGSDQAPGWLQYTPLVCTQRGDGNTWVMAEGTGLGRQARWADLSDQQVLAEAWYRLHYWALSRPTTIGHRMLGALLNREVGDFSKLLVVEILKEFQPPHRVMDNCGFVVLALSKDGVAAYTNIRQNEWGTLDFDGPPRRLAMDRSRAAKLLAQISETARKLPAVVLDVPSTGLPFTTVHYYESDGKKIDLPWAFATFSDPYYFLEGREWARGTDEDVLRVMRNPKWRPPDPSTASASGVDLFGEESVPYEPEWRSAVISDPKAGTLLKVAARYHEVIRQVWDVTIGLPKQQADEDANIFEEPTSRQAKQERQ